MWGRELGVVLGFFFRRGITRNGEKKESINDDM